MQMLRLGGVLAGALALATTAQATPSLSGAELVQVCGPPGTRPTVLATATDSNPVELNAVVDCGGGFHLDVMAFGLVDPATLRVAPTMGFRIETPTTANVTMPADLSFQGEARGFTQQGWRGVAGGTLDIPGMGEMIPLQIEVDFSLELEIIKPLTETQAQIEFLGQLVSFDLGLFENVQGFMNDQGQGAISTSSGGSSPLPVLFEPTLGRSFVHPDTTYVFLTMAPFGQEFGIDASFGGRASLSSCCYSSDSLWIIRALGDHTFSYSLESLDPRVVFEAVPEPSTGLLVAAGLTALMLGMRRRPS